MSRADLSLVCPASIPEDVCLRPDWRKWPGTVTEDARGRARIYLGREKGMNLCPAANSGGWTWLPRYIVWELIGEVLRKDEHVHHECEMLWCSNPWHYRVILAEYHGRIHAAATLIFRMRDCLGRWKPGRLQIPDPDPRTYPVPRRGAVIGRAAA
jgi:hypothetical protein